MAESQIVKKIVPSLKISTMDNHRMLTPPGAAPSRKGTRPPRHVGGGQPTRHASQDVVFKAQPMDVVMHGGGAVLVKRPPAPGTRAPMIDPGKADPFVPTAPLIDSPHQSIALEMDRGVPALTPAMASLCIDSISAHLEQIGEVALASAEQKTKVELARQTVGVLMDLIAAASFR